MIKITDEQRDAVDAQIRKRIYHEKYPTGRQTFLPEAAIMFARASLELGVNLEYACPYMRDCDNKTPALCINHPYRECTHYKLRLALDILDSKVTLTHAGLEETASSPAK